MPVVARVQTSKVCRCSSCQVHRSKAEPQPHQGAVSTVVEFCHPISILRKNTTIIPEAQDANTWNFTWADGSRTTQTMATASTITTEMWVPDTSRPTTSAPRCIGVWPR